MHAIQLHRIFLALAILVAAVACSDDANEQAAAPAAPDTPEAPTAALPENTTTARAPGEPAPWQTLPSPLSSRIADAYRERCTSRAFDRRQCIILHSLAVAEVTMALEEIERSRDQRGTTEALSALDLAGEPEILVAAMRILGHFPDTPGIADKALPLLLQSPYLEVQQTAASLLAANPDATLAALGSYWGTNHSALPVESAYQEYPDFPAHYPGMGYPEYPGAQWFSPADSDRSVGWWTTDDFPTVSAWLAEELETEGLDYAGWAQRVTQESMAVFPTIDPARQAEMERLTEEWVQSQDMAVLEKLTKLQQELYAPVEAAGKVADEMAEKGVTNLGPPIAAETQEQVRFFIVEERAGHVARLVIAYPLASLGHTAIQHAWSLMDYPGAWPPADN